MNPLTIFVQSVINSAYLSKWLNSLLTTNRSEVRASGLYV